jgi:oligopeptidase B
MLTVRRLAQVRRFWTSRFSAEPTVSPFQNFIEDENNKFAKFYERTAKVRSELFDEAVNMLLPEGITPPELNKGYFYFQRIDGAGRLRFCRVPADSTGKLVDIDSSTKDLEEEILSLTDVATSFSNNGFADVSAAKISVDNQFLGFIADVKGDERWNLFFRDLTRSKYTDDTVPLVRNFEWIDNVLSPGRFLYYTEMDPMTLRSVRVVRAEVGNLTGSRKNVWEIDPSDQASYADLFKSKDGKCIFMSSSSKTKSEVFVVHSDDPEATPVLVHPPCEGVEYFCEHRDGYIYIVSNMEFTNYALYRKPINGNELELMYHSPDMTIRDMDMFRKGIVLYGHGFEGQPAVEILRFKDSVDPDTVPDDLSDYDEFGIADVVKIPFKGSYAIGKVEVGVNGDFESDVCRFTFRNPKNPGTCLEFRFLDRKLEAIKSREYQRKGSVDMSVDRVGVRSLDGQVEIPLTLVSPDNIDPEAPGPCLVYVYGAYGQVLEPDFSPAVISLLKRGWTIAFAHVRGGGERGPEWHYAGARMNRLNSVADFKACIDWLVQERIALPSSVFAIGASAGGAVLGAALNKYGKALVGGGAILRVPFVDLYNTLKDPTLPLSSHEADEWGNVNDVQEGEFVKSISPADNIPESAQDWFPPLFITCAEDDSRVPFQGVVNYAKVLRKSIQGADRLVFRTFRSGEGGHFGSISTAGDYDDTCVELAFLLHVWKRS